MTPEEIKAKIQTAMSTLQRNSKRYKIVQREEGTYFLDPSKVISQLLRIDDQHLHFEQLIREFSKATKGEWSSILTFPEQKPQLFEILKSEGYQPVILHDIRYQLVEEHSYQEHPIQTIIVQTREDIIKQHKTDALSFGHPYKERSEEAIQSMIKEYNSPSPYSVRFLAIENDEITKEPRILGTGGIKLFDNIGVATLMGGCTIPTARNRGVYSALIDARLRYVQMRGVSLVGIFANQKTSSPIVQRLGFKKCGEMQPWERKAKS